MAPHPRFADSVLVRIGMTVARARHRQICPRTPSARLRLSWSTRIAAGRPGQPVVPLITFVVAPYISPGLRSLIPWPASSSLRYITSSRSVLKILAPSRLAASELEDAARVDRCSRFSAFLGVILPYSRHRVSPPAA